MMKGERDAIQRAHDQLLVEVNELRRNTIQLSVERDAALAEKSRFEGVAMLAMQQGDQVRPMQPESTQGDVVEAEKEKPADTEPIWKRVGRSIRKRF